MQIIVGAFDAHKDLRAVGVDDPAAVTTFCRLRASKIVLALIPKRRELCIGKLNEDTLGPLSEDVDFFDTSDVQEALPERFAPLASIVVAASGLPAQYRVRR